MNSYEEALNVVLSLINKNENIILYGNGSNGKSYLINQLKENLKQYVVYHEFDINLINKQSIKPMVKPMVYPFITSINSVDEIKSLDKNNYKLVDMNHIRF